MLPFSIVVEGVPVSLQTKSKPSLSAWKAKIRNEAIAVAAGRPAETGRVSFLVTHYFDVSGPDVDNIIKPIQDALVGVVYVDDRQVQHTSSRRRDLNDSYKIKKADSALLLAFANGKDFVHILVGHHVDTGDLTQ